MKNALASGFVFSLLALLLTPQFVFAADTLIDVLCTLGGLVGLATPIVVALALFGFFWGLAMYMFSLSTGGDTGAHSAYGQPATPQSKNAGRTIMIYGILVLFVMLSIWGIVNVLQVTFGVGGGAINPPRIAGAEMTTGPTRLSCPGR
ncbi:hypothetical protein K2P56_02200 [Patescibacteria group bacterium]|nr:hypothetical protein [Patescibacteria group bacterium]